MLIARVELLGATFKPLWLLGTATLGAAKILENMEIGHNVMHGQWDWMNDPVINSQSWDWDTASTKEAWKHSHNYVHHHLHEHPRAGQGPGLHRLPAVECGGGDGG